MKINLGVDRLPEVTGMPSGRQPYLGGIMEFGGFIADMDRAQFEARSGRLGTDPHVEVCIPTFHDPSLAPEGRHAASAFALCAPIGATQPERVRLRDEMAERIVERVAAVAPNFPDAIERQIAYPAYSYELMFGCTGGDFTHALLHPEQMGAFRPGPRGWRDLEVPIGGLYLCGAGCHGGPGVTFIPGYNAGHAVLDAVG